MDAISKTEKSKKNLHLDFRANIIKISFKKVRETEDEYFGSF